MTKRSARNRRAGRDAIAHRYVPDVPRPLQLPTWVNPDSTPDLLPFEDLRRWEPGRILDYPPARRVDFKPARIHVAPGRRVASPQGFSSFSPFSLPSRVAFAAPERVLVCVRRQTRRQVLHALNVAGGRGFRRPRRSRYSSISCRR